MSTKSLRMLFQDISPEKIFNFLKEINIHLLSMVLKLYIDPF